MDLNLMNGVNSTASDPRAEDTSVGLIDNKSLQTLSNENIDIKGMVSDLNSMTGDVAEQAINNISYRTSAQMLRGSSMGAGQQQYTSIQNATTPGGIVRSLTNSTVNTHMDAYMNGLNQYFNNLDSVYSAVGNLAQIQAEAEIYDAQNELSWANQALAEAEFEEYKRHNNVLLDQAERRKAEAERKAAAKESATSSFLDGLLNSSSSSSANTGLFGGKFQTSPEAAPGANIPLPGILTGPLSGGIAAAQNNSGSGGKASETEDRQARALEQASSGGYGSGYLQY